MKSISRNVIWAVIFAIIIVVCLAFIMLGNNQSRIAVIYQNDKVIMRIDDLYPDKTEHAVIETYDGYNKIAWYDGKIWVEEADCKNQTCVHFGKLSSTGLSIICAPHGLVITIEDSDDGDSTVDAIT